MWSHLGSRLTLWDKAIPSVTKDTEVPSECTDPASSQVGMEHGARPRAELVQTVLHGLGPLLTAAGTAPHGLPVPRRLPRGFRDHLAPDPRSTDGDISKPVGGGPVLGQGRNSEILGAGRKE